MVSFAGMCFEAPKGFPGGSEVKASACNAGDLGSIPGSGRSLEKEMATHSSILAWRIPWTEEPGGLQSTGSQRVRHNWVTSLSLVTTVYIDGTWKCTASWEIPQTASLLPLYDISYWVYSTRHPLWNWHLEFTAEHRLCFLVLTFTSPPGHETLPHSFICLMKRQWSSNLVAQ